MTHLAKEVHSVFSDLGNVLTELSENLNQLEENGEDVSNERKVVAEQASRLANVLVPGAKNVGGM